MPAVVDLAAMRDAIADLGGDPAVINPLIPAELVIDHSVQVDAFASRLAFARNVELEVERNRERYAFLRWGQSSFRDFKVVPPGTGICHQVNLEYLARVVESRDGVAFPDTVVGLDSHTTMVNGLGVLGWGVGGIEAEAAMLGEPLSMLVPQVVGLPAERAAARGHDRDRPRAHRDRAAAPDRRRRQVRRVLRRGRLEPHGRRPRDAREHVARVRRDVRLLPGRRADARLPAPDRARRRSRSRSSRRTAARTCSGTSRTSIPSTRRWSSSTSTTSSRRSPGRAARRTACRSRGRRRRSSRRSPPSASSPTTTTRRSPRRSRRATRRPSRRRAGTQSTEPERAAVAVAAPPRPRTVRVDDRRRGGRARPRRGRDRRDHLVHEHVEPAGDDRRRPARQARGRARAAPRAVGEDLARAGLARRHRLLRARRACRPTSTSSASTRSATAARPASATRARCPPRSRRRSPRATSSRARCSPGNRNFEARIHPEVKANYLASPPLVVAYALAGRIDIDLENEPLARTRRRQRRVPARPLADLGGDPGDDRLVGARRDVHAAPTPTCTPATRSGGASRRPPATSTPGTAPRPTSACRPTSTACSSSRRAVADIEGARCLVSLGDSVTTDHISPAGSIRLDSPAGRYLTEHGVEHARLQLVRLAPRQPRGDGARHLRERPAAQPARPRLRGHLDEALPVGRGDDDLRGVRALPRRGHAAGRARRQGVRLGLVARLGRQGPAACSASRR